jgi:SET domain-containing protein
VVLLSNEPALEEQMAFTHSNSIEVKRIKGKGRGVFARSLIRKGELIEKVPMLVLSVEEYHDGISKTSLENYCFNWGEGTVALALGYGSRYNHSYKPNARYDDVAPQTKDFTALRDIQPGEDITVNYNAEPRSRATVWFEVVEAAVPTGAEAP